ncbi:MAG: hypothetical protein OXB93_04475 [Cytophagales bacterium]|nr:hypothetical protein [Cytophagales bacterium]
MRRRITDDDIISYLYGETSEEESRWIENLMKTDKKLRALCDSYQRLLRELDGYSVSPSPGFTKRVMDRIAGKIHEES